MSDQTPLPSPVDLSGTIDEITAAVGDNQAAAALVLVHERTGKNRKTLVAALEAVLATPQNPTDGPAEGPEEPSAPPDPTERVIGRWVSTQAVDAVEQGLILYGDRIEVTAEQLADDRTPVITWDDDWEPDPDLWQQSRLYDAPSDTEVPDGFVHNPRS